MGDEVIGVEWAKRGLYILRDMTKSLADKLPPSGYSYRESFNQPCPT
jgi:hypothetical protein